MYECLCLYYNSQIKNKYFLGLYFGEAHSHSPSASATKVIRKKIFYLPKLVPEFNFPPRIIKPDILTHELLPFKLPPAVVWSAFEGAFVFFFQKIVNT